MGFQMIFHGVSWEEFMAKPTTFFGFVHFHNMILQRRDLFSADRAFDFFSMYQFMTLEMIFEWSLVVTNVTCEFLLFVNFHVTQNGRSSEKEPRTKVAKQFLWIQMKIGKM